MKTYPEQPPQDSSTRENIEEILIEDLPDCSTNEWFIQSIHFANMVDRIVNRLYD